MKAREWDGVQWSGGRSLSACMCQGLCAGFTGAATDKNKKFMILDSPFLSYLPSPGGEILHSHVMEKFEKEVLIYHPFPLDAYPPPPPSPLSVEMGGLGSTLSLSLSGMLIALTWYDLHTC